MGQDRVARFRGQAEAPALANQRVQDLDLLRFVHRPQAAETHERAGPSVLRRPLTKAPGGKRSEAGLDEPPHGLPADDPVVPQEAAHIGLGEEGVQDLLVHGQEGTQQ
jgi:hypothetical protein